MDRDIEIEKKRLAEAKRSLAEANRSYELSMVGVAVSITACLFAVVALLQSF